MLFHGTNKEGVVGILKEGFKNSPKGWFGQGVYMTEWSEEAFNYSHLRTAENDPDCCCDDLDDDLDDFNGDGGDGENSDDCRDGNSSDSDDDDCVDYSSDYDGNDDDTESYGYVFVNEVLESHILQATEYEISVASLPKDNDTIHENKFNMYKTKKAPLPINANYKRDKEGRKYRNVEHCDESNCVEYVADESVTIPRYLIVVVT